MKVSTLATALFGIFALASASLSRALVRNATSTPHQTVEIRAATLHAGESLYEPLGQRPEIGAIRPTYLADFAIVEENPIQNLKVLYGNGTPRLNDETGEVERVGGIRYVIKDGIIYDAKELLADVARMVSEQKAERGITEQ